MKNTLLCTIAMLLLCAAASAQATVVGSCTDVTIKGNTIPAYDQDLYNITNQSSPCAAVVSNPAGTMKARMFL
jgi:hypothetical protein